MRIYKTETRSRKVIKGYQCDLCKKTELNFTMYYLAHTFGFGTKYGMKSIDLDICEDCLVNLFHQFIK